MTPSQHATLIQAHVEHDQARLVERKAYTKLWDAKAELDAANAHHYVSVSQWEKSAVEDMTPAIHGALIQAHVEHDQARIVERKAFDNLWDARAELDASADGLAAIVRELLQQEKS